MLVRTACIQLNAAPDIQENLDAAGFLIRQAASEGAQFIATPENTCHMRGMPSDKLKSSLPEESHAGIPFFAALAKELGIWLLIGSMAVKISSPLLAWRNEGGSEEKIANRSFLFSDKGEIVARYDKIHLFDVDLHTGESHRESDLVKPGQEAVIADLPWGKLGMSICYDLRFSHLYRDMAKSGAEILAVPAAFTVPTGLAHWETLLRARAIETGSFVVAPAQCGEHEGERKTHGHSLIIDPWGKILAEGGADTGVIFADLDLDTVQKARTAIPSLKHDREYDRLN